MLDRKAAPAYVQSTGFDLLKPVHHHLPNGIDLFFVNGGAQDVIKIELILKAGRWYESPWGTSYFTAHLLSKGTTNKNSFEIAQGFDQYGAHLDLNSGLDHIAIALYTLTKNLDPVLNLLHEILLHPTFPQKELDQAKAIYLQNLKINQEKTSFLASKLFRKSVFGDAHPYGKELEEQDIEHLQRLHLVEHFQDHFGQFSVFVSGKVEGHQQQQLRDLFSAWVLHDVPSRSLPASNGGPVREHVDKEGSVQASIRMGRRSILRNDPDYTGAIFVSHILGGYFGSRLMKNIREEKGLTYGIHASIHPMQHGSYLVIGADVNRENVSLTFDEIRKELKRLRTKKISDDELETARNHFIGSLQSELTTPFAHADKLKTIYLFGLPPDYYQRMILDIKNMTPDEIIRISETHFRENDLSELSVG